MKTVLLSSLLAALAASSAPPAAMAQTASSDASAIDPGTWPQADWPFAEDAALEARVQALLSRMRVEDKVGQIVQGDIGSLTPEDVRKYRLGSVLAGGNSDPGGKYTATPAQWLALADAIYAASMDTSGGGVAIPALFGVDAVHGHNNLVGATLFPHNIGLGAARDPALIGRIAVATAAEVRATGPEWTFAPTLTVPRDDRWGRTYEGYSEDPTLVASYAAAAIEGLQGKANAPGFLDGTRVLASAKHFLADGGTRDGRDQGDAQIDQAQLREIHGTPYEPAIAAGTQTVMASFSSWQGRKMHGNRALLTDVLKTRMGFGGFVVGDWNAHGQLPGCSNTDCAAAFNAGVDMLMTPDTWRGYYDSALRDAKSGVIPMRRLDEAVARILRVKLRMGLFEAGKPSQRALGGKFERLGSAQHRALAREAVRKSLVLLKNDGGVLPLDPRKRILVAGDGADSVSKQAGGWTLTWQGTGVTPADFPNAQSIWAGVREQVQAAGGTATLAPDGRYQAKPDAAIVVFGEEPYAEFQGDLATLQYKPANDADLQLLRRLKSAGIPVVAVFLSGRPLWVNRELNASDAFVAAWLPGSEGGGVADVLLQERGGGVQHDFTGTLSFSWPRDASGAPLNVGDADYRPQFAFGYGLRYADPRTVGTLPETSGVSADAGAANQFFVRGKPRTGLRLRLLGADGAGVDAVAMPATSADGALRVTAIDYKAQEDARRLQWTAPATVELASDAPIDLNRETNGDVLLAMTLRIDAVAGDAALSARCGKGCAARLPVGEWLASLPRGRWITAGVPLKCLRAAGADVARLDVPFALEASAATDLSLATVSAGTDVEHVMPCRRE